MEHVVTLERAVTGFAVTEQHIDCMCGRELLKVERASGRAAYRKTIFEKEGLSRKLAAEGGQLFVYDFCTLYAFAQEDYALLGKWRLGEDLSSDICGMAVDEDTVYCSIRNGKIVGLDRRSFDRREARVSDSSMWSVRPYGEYLVCGTVDGRLLLLEKRGLNLVKSLGLGKKNIASLCLDGGTLYAVGQDGRLFKVSLESFQVEAVARNVHRKMFRCAGLWRDMLVTVSYPCSEMALWGRESLEKRGGLSVPLRLSGQVYIEGDGMYIASRNIMGIDRVRFCEFV